MATPVDDMRTLLSQSVREEEMALLDEAALIRLHENHLRTAPVLQLVDVARLIQAPISLTIGQAIAIKTGFPAVITPETTWATLQQLVAAEHNFQITPGILDAMARYSLASLGRTTGWERLLQHWPEAVTFNTTGRSTHDTSTHLDPHAIGDWDVPDLEIAETLWSLLTVSLPARTDVGGVPCQNEGQSNMAFVQHILHDVNAVLTALTNAGKLGYWLHYSIDEEAADDNNCKPDFIGTKTMKKADGTRGDSFVFALGEGKKPSVLAQSRSLRQALPSLKDAYFNSTPPGCRSAVGQVNGYAKNETHTQNSKPPRALFLTTCQMTWIMQRDSATNILYIAQGRSIVSTFPSVAQHVAYLALKFADDAMSPQRADFPAGSVAVVDPSRPAFNPQLPTGAPARPLVLKAANQQESDSQGGSQQQQQQQQQQQHLAVLPSVLGRGRSCVVRLGRMGTEDVAIKYFSLRNIRAAQRELAVYEDLLRLQGSVLPRLLESGWTEGAFVIVLQRAPGRHPHQLGYHVTERQLLNALQALRAMHDEGRLHNDLHIGNIMIDETTDKVMLLDLSESTRWTNKAQCRQEAEKLASDLWYCSSQSREPTGLPSGSAHPLPHWLSPRHAGSMPAALLAGF